MGILRDVEENKWVRGKEYVDHKTSISVKNTFQKDNSFVRVFYTLQSYVVVAVYTILIATFANDKRTLLPHFYAEHWRLRDKINMRFYVNDKSIVSFRMHYFDPFRDLHVNPFILRNCNKYLYYEHGYAFPPFFVNDLSNCGISV